MATTELNPAKRVNISRGDDSAEKADESHATATSCRQTECYQFRAIDLLHYAFSVSFFFVDLATDSIVCVEYLLQGHSSWGCFTMVFIILPACVTQLFSLRWHRSDGSLQTVHWLSHFLLLGFLHRYLTLFYAAMCSLRNKPSFSRDRNWVYRQESDICMLHLFQSFMGAAPQLILQLYVIAMLHHAPLWTSLSAVASFCSLTWAVSTYMRAMHNINRERNNATWIALALQTFWRGGMLLSRIGVLVLAAVFLKAWFFLFLGLHWLFMTIWVILQKTEFCPTVWEERIYNCIIGLIYCFDFFNLCEGKSRYRVFVFYSVFIVQNLIFLTMYALRFQGTIADTVMVTIASLICSSMFIGLMSMLLYYGEYHPSRMAARASRNVNEHSAKVDTPRSFKLFHRGSLASLHHSIDISPRIEKMATDKQSLLRNIAQMSDCTEEGIINRNYSLENKSNASSSVRISTECERPHSRVGAGKHKDEVLLKDNLDNALVGSAPLSCPYPGLADIDSSRKRRGIYEHDITPQLDWYAPDILNIDLDRLGNLDHGEWNNSLSLDTCGKVIDVLDIIKNRGKLTTPTSLESGRIFDIEKQRDETMSCVTSIHDYENVCPLGIARPPWCIRSWKGYTDIETYIHDDSVVRDRRRDTLTSTTGTTYSSEYSDGIISRGALKEQDDYADALTYDLVESKDAKVSYSDDSFSASTVDDRNANLFVAKPVVIDDRGGMLALDTILEERDDSGSSDEFQRGMEPLRNSASTLVSTIDQIRRYTAENSPRHVYHTTGAQWEDLNPKNLMARAHFAKVLFDNDLRNASATTSPAGLTAQDAEKREIDAIREVVRCCAIESIKKTPLIEAILSDSPILGSRASKLARQITFADRKDDFDVNESDLYVEMSPLVSVENGENSSQTKLVDAKAVETEITKRSNPPAISKKSPDKENLAPILPSNNRRISNMRYDNSDNNDRRAWTIERDDKYDRSMCNVRFNLKEKRHLFLEQVLSPVPKLWNKRISFHPNTKNL
ncbi:uncharacterized protein [Linepithema humile]|uniref:uncharacterized protein isoform X2 n=1 Tax=Linepithema humile TaxID=83485 RepID=UPI00351F5D41